MLGNLLHSIRTAVDTASLFAALGYERDVRPLDDRAWVVAHWRGFQVVACDAADPRTESRALASRLGSASLRALAVAVGGGELALAAPRLGVGGSTRVQRISLSDPQPSAVHFLETLRPDGAPNALAHAIRLAELLSTENVGERFFVAFRQVLERMTASLSHRGSAADRRIAALLPLTRIIFLYFVQAKGWLDHRPDYLRRLLDTTLARRKHFHRSALNPLFFGTLNRHPAQRSHVASLGSIPYLNGGLFEPHPVERRLGPLVFPNELWRDAFDLLFERFRFCVREADETDAIAPDMLGRVFERVMDASARKDTGTFYTPETVVRQVVGAAIETALLARLTRANTGRILHGAAGDITEVDRARDAVRGLRVLDPAVGSGAFLLGALERLTEIRLAVDPSLAGDRSQVRRAILAENLFGVDLSPIAVRLAELRLWLAVIADDPTTDIARVAPLPNLDGVVRQGDSLLDPIGAARAYHAGPYASPIAAARAVSSARRSMFDATGDAVRDAVKRLRARESALAAELVGGAFRSVGHQLRDLAATASSPDLFGRAGRLTQPQRKRYRQLLRHRRVLRRSGTALADGQIPFFAFEVHAPDVMTAGGFDIVLGNPPWVRAERVDPATRRTLQERFSWWRTTKGRGFAHLPDLAVAFLERAIELTVPGGVVALLVPAKVASSGYGEAARKHLVAETRLAYLHRIPEKEASRFAATTYPLAIVLAKKRPGTAHRVKLDFAGRTSLKQARLAGPGPWILVPDRDRDALEQLRAAGQPMREIAEPALGVKTGADDLFVGSLLERQGPIARFKLAQGEIDIEWDLLRPAVRGRDVRPFQIALERALIWTHEPGGSARDTLPPFAAAYFHTHRSRLRARADYRDGPPWALFRVRPVDGNRVVWADIARRPAAAVLEASGVPRAIPLNTCYTARTPDRGTALLIAAVLNSVWSAALAHVTADEARGGYRRINLRVAGAFPIPPSGTATDALISLSTQAHEHNDVAAGDLDDAVAEAFHLPAAVRRSIRNLAARSR